MKRGLLALAILFALIALIALAVAALGIDVHWVGWK